MTEGTATAAKVDLAHERDFALGGLRITPSACRVASGVTQERVEPRVMEVLVILARGEGRTVTREQLIDACWGGRAVSDDAVTRVIARVRALGRSAEPPHFILETLPKVGFRLTAAPAGQQETQPEQQSASVSAPVSTMTRRRMFPFSARAVAAVLAAIALGAVGVWLAFAGRQARETPVIPTVAVAPFGTLGQQPELIELSRKAQEAVVRRLIGAGVPASMMSPVGPPPEGTDLRVQGEVEFANGTYAIRARLDYPKDTAVWSARFERAAEEVAGLDEEVAYGVAESLACALSDHAAAPPSARRTLLPLLLAHCRSIDTHDHEGAVIAGRRLVAAAPELSFAHGRLARSLAEQATWFEHLPDQEEASMREARTAAAAALTIDPEDVAAHVALGVRVVGADYAERERHLTRALARDPHSRAALRHYAEFLRDVGRIKASRDVLARLEHSATTAMYRAMIDAMHGDPVSAENQLAQLALVRPQWAKEGRWMIAAFWEDPKRAAETLPALSIAAQASQAPCILDRVSALASAGGRSLKGLPAICDGLSADWRVRLLARQGDVDGAFALLNGDWPINRAHWFLFYPELKSVRADPRFVALAERLGLAAYWRATNRWPDFCSETDCRAWRSSN